MSRSARPVIPLHSMAADELDRYVSDELGSMLWEKE